MLAFFKKIFSAVIAFIVSVTTYPISFMPFRADTDFSVGNECTVYEQTEDGNAVIFDVNEETGWFNYYALKYTSDAYINGVITYGSGFGREISEEFFLEPAENGVFYSFIDGCLDKTKARNIISVKVTSKQNDNFDFSLLGVYTFNRDIPDDEVFLSNGQYKIGIDLNWGGALTYMEDLNSDVEAVKKDGRIYVDSNASVRYGKRAVNRHVNLINRHDAGRLVQQSYYGVEECPDYVNGEFSTSDKWPYNPVQGGNKYAGCSKIVDLRVNDNSIYVKCRPMDWAKDDEAITPSYMEATFEFVGNTLHTSCRFTDFSGYPANRRNQELPAFYCIEPLNKFVYYGGSAPWTGDTLSSEPDLPFWAGPNKKKFTAAENWAAFTGEFEDSFGIGLYSPERNKFVPGVYERGNTTEKDPSAADPTSYFAVVDAYNFESFKTFEYDYYLTTGDTAEIRENFKAIAG